MNILHRLTFARGSESLEFVRTLRELSETQPESEVARIGPVLVYGARIVPPDVPAELYVSLGALALAHRLGLLEGDAPRPQRPASLAELPADMALLFTASSMPDEYTLHGGLP